MSPSQPPPPDREGPEPERAGEAVPGARRPRYLVVALVAALLFGAGCLTEGCERLAFYRGDQGQHAQLTSSLHDDGDRAEANQLYQRFVDVSDQARGRAIPMAAATFVLGAALLLTLALGGLAGKSNTRSVLMQLVAAQAIVVVASYFLTRDMWAAEADWKYGTAQIHQRQRVSPDEYERALPMLRAMRHYVPPGWLVLRTVASALIVVALSRPRARDFFEAAARPVSER